MAFAFVVFLMTSLQTLALRFIHFFRPPSPPPQQKRSPISGPMRTRRSNQLTKREVDETLDNPFETGFTYAKSWNAPDNPCEIPRLCRRYSPVSEQSFLPIRKIKESGGLKLILPAILLLFTAFILRPLPLFCPTTTPTAARDVDESTQQLEGSGLILYEVLEREMQALEMNNMGHLPPAAALGMCSFDVEESANGLERPEVCEMIGFLELNELITRSLIEQHNGIVRFVPSTTALAIPGGNGTIGIGRFKLNMYFGLGKFNTKKRYPLEPIQLL